MNSKKKVIIIGAGPGGLSSGMILAHRGYDVTVYEKQSYVGGRTSPHKEGDFLFELGPTFVMLPQIFEEVFAMSGKKLSDYVELKRLETMYRLHFSDGRDFHVYFDKQKLKQEITRLFPGDEAGYDRYLAEQKVKFDKMYPCLKIPYLTPLNYLNPKLLRALPAMQIFKTLYQVLSGYFKNKDLRISMAFQAKYLGMSPWACPGPFSILSYMEHAFGVFHPMGGVHKLTEAMAKVLQENGGKLLLNTGVKKILVENGKAVGVQLENGEEKKADIVIMNTDFAKGMIDMVKNETRPSWSNRKLARSSYSCSTFMLYLGLKKKYDFEHHNIFFANNYKRNVDEISAGILSKDFSLYVQNASVTDPSLAPEGKSAIYILVPVPNLVTGIDWEKEKSAFRDLVLDKLASDTEMKDIREQIEIEKIITPLDWQNDKFVYQGAVFNLAHTLGQMLYLRPHNKFEDISGLYIVGGGTHPGSGLPTILESGRIAADLIEQN
ncbi:MAG: phytoene desaturase family protein [Candidatus Falkowbacteria bacterium]|nr:phytoene desaturase family protein [Candidatus Falkowbacteria bacterium]